MRFKNGKAVNQPSGNVEPPNSNQLPKQIPSNVCLCSKFKQNRSKTKLGVTRLLRLITKEINHQNTLFDFTILKQAKTVCLTFSEHQEEDEKAVFWCSEHRLVVVE